MTKLSNNLITKKKLRLNLQNLSLKNFYLSHEYVSNLIDKFRDEKLKPIKHFNTKKRLNLRILHVTNFNERHDGRLFFNTGRRLNNGFIRLGHSILEFSDRDIQKYYKSYRDISGAKTLNDLIEELILTFKNHNIEIVVVNDCSPDSTHEEMEILIRKYKK